MPDDVLRLIYTEHGLSAREQGPDLAVCNILAFFSVFEALPHPIVRTREIAPCVQVENK